MAIRVFLADDHAVLRQGMKMLIESEGDLIVVGDAADGREAVCLVQQLTPDVVAMDIAMPELNGIEATLQIRGRRPATQVIILSMHGGPKRIFRVLQAGTQAYLLK